MRSVFQTSLLLLWAGSSNGFALLSRPGAPLSSTRVVRYAVAENAAEDTVVEEETAINPEAEEWKTEILGLAKSTDRGFRASRQERREVNQLVEKLKTVNPTKEPAASYYDEGSRPTPAGSSAREPDLTGKWTLVYTDAPDITGLDTSRNPLATAKLGRIGQECKPPFIKNVIEWKRPEWAKNLPFAGSDESRVLQKVVTSGKSTPENPFEVKLDVVGLELMAPPKSDDEDTTTISNGISGSIEKEGLLSGLLQSNGPIEIKGFLTPPFGKFQVLYLDNDLRIIRTYQGYLAINKRIHSRDEEWF